MALSKVRQYIAFYEVELTFILLYWTLVRTYLSSAINHRRPTMHILFKSRAPLAAELHDLARTRVLFVLRRFSVRIPHATVQMSDVNGPRGGVDKRCQVELQTDRGRPVVINAVAAQWRTALDNALSRASRLLARRFERAVASRRARACTLAQDN